MSEDPKKDGPDSESCMNEPGAADGSEDMYKHPKSLNVPQTIAAFQVEDKDQYKNILLQQGKAFFSIEAYPQAMEVFQKAAELGSYQGKFLLGIAMIESSPAFYFEGLRLVTKVTCSMLVRPYLDLLRSVLEKGHALKLIPTYEEEVQPDLREIALTVNALDGLSPEEEKKGLGKLLKMLQASRAN